MISDWITCKIQFKCILVIVFRYSFVSTVKHYIIFFFELCEFLFHWQRVGPPIFEWAVPRPFVHLRVEIMALLSMSSDWIFMRINLVGPPIFEWAVPRPFVHFRVEIMVLLSMSSDWIFIRINYFHSKMDKRSWHSPLKDGPPYFCQWKSGSRTRKKNNVVLNFETKE